MGWGLHAVTLCVDDMSNIDGSNPHNLYGVGKHGLPTDSLGIEKFTLTGESGDAAQISFTLGSGSETVDCISPILSLLIFFLGGCGRWVVVLL